MCCIQKMRILLFVMLLGVFLGWGGEIYGADQADVNKPDGAAANPPREMAMQPLPAYRINPPDVLNIEMLKMIPLQPYRIAIFDVLQIRASFALPEQPINDNYIVEDAGEVNLGPAYGSVKVVGMTIDEATKAMAAKLAEKLRQPEVSVQLARSSGTQPVTGEYLVASDGRINLRKYGTVLIKGKTIAEVQQLIEKHLAKFFVSPEVSVEVKGYNSQVYYVITDGAGMGDNVRRLPITGNETVLDAIAATGGLSQMSGKKMWIARPSAGNAEKGTVLNIDYEAITQLGATATNYQIIPGDRLFIESDPIIALNNNLGKKTAPIERTLGLLGLEASTLGAKRNFGQPPAGGTATQPPKQPSKADKIDADMTDALYNYLEELIPMLKN